MSGFMLSGCHATLVLDVLNIASEGELLNGRIYREAVIWREWQLRCAGCTMAGRAARGQSQTCESEPSPGSGAVVGRCVPIPRWAQDLVPALQLSAHSGWCDGGLSLPPYCVFSWFIT